VGVGLKTTTAGWFPKPLELRRARWRFSEGEIGETALHAAEARARADALTLQAELGLDLWVDGQMERSDPATFFAERVTGMEVGGLVRCFGNRYYRKPRIVGDVEPGEPLTVEVWKAAQAAAARPVKAVLTGPYTLMDWSFDEHYGSRERCCRALAEVVRAEAEALAAAGAREIQLDEPAIAARPAELPLAAEVLAHVTAPLRGHARTWVHIGYGDLLPVCDALFALPVDGLLLEMANSGFPLLERLGDLPPDKQLGAGVVDVHSEQVESARIVRERGERLLAHVGAERLWLMPDGALRTLDAAAARGKLQALVEAAAAL
jgi:5-methyltetrahydropteroyltriglutamate--homocysteine methyltransferase